MSIVTVIDECDDDRTIYVPYPFLCRNTKYRGLVVFAFEQGVKNPHDCFRGIAMTDFPEGDIKQGSIHEWTFQDFILFKGEVVIENKS